MRPLGQQIYDISLSSYRMDMNLTLAVDQMVLPSSFLRWWARHSLVDAPQLTSALHEENCWS